MKTTNEGEKVLGLLRFRTELQNCQNTPMDINHHLVHSGWRRCRNVSFPFSSGGKTKSLSAGRKKENAGPSWTANLDAVRVHSWFKASFLNRYCYKEIN
ncbi:MAG: hypothetical protein MJ202_00310 [Lentisphaeria bacterium]|nr:hypothetical protein [Lentisphaeria bacterium]